MDDTEGRTSKLAAALARSGQAMSPAAEAKRRRHAIPMNGTIQNRGLRVEEGPAREPPRMLGDTTSPQDTASGAAAPVARTARAASGAGRSTYDRQHARLRSDDDMLFRPVRRRRLSGRVTLVGAFVLVAGVAVGALLMMRSGPDAARIAAEPEATIPPPALDRTLADGQEGLPSQQNIGAIPSAPPGLPPARSPSDPTGADPTVAQTVGTPAPDMPGLPATEPTPSPDIAFPRPSAPATLESTRELQRPARAVPAVVPPSPVAVRPAPSVGAIANPLWQLTAAPRAEPVVVIGTELAATAETAASPSERDALFDQPHTIILHYNPTTPGAADQASRLADSLTAAGADPVRVATVPFTISSTHLRQYHTEDAPLADAVSDLADNSIEIRDFTDFSPRPAPGLIEVWIASG